MATRASDWRIFSVSARSQVAAGGASQRFATIIEREWDLRGARSTQFLKETFYNVDASAGRPLTNHVQCENRDLEDELDVQRGMVTRAALPGADAGVLRVASPAARLAADRPLSHHDE